MTSNSLKIKKINSETQFDSFFDIISSIKKAKWGSIGRLYVYNILNGTI